MRFWIYIMVSLLAMAGAFAELGCDDGGCSVGTPGGGKVYPWRNTRYTSPMPYKGRADAIVAYYKEVTPEMGSVSEGGCTSSGCTYWLLARVLIHNPTNELMVADVKYDWTVDDEQKAASNRIKNVPIPPHKTVAVELGEQYTATQGMRYSISGQATVTIVSGAP